MSLDRAQDMRDQLARELERTDVGIDVTLTGEPAGATYDDATQTYSGGTAETDTGRGRIGSYGSWEVDGTRILASDYKITWQPSDWDFIPLAGMNVSWGGETRKVIFPKARRLGDKVLCYTLQVR